MSSRPICYTPPWTSHSNCHKRRLCHSLVKAWVSTYLDEIQQELASACGIFASPAIISHTLTRMYAGIQLLTAHPGPASPKRVQLVLSPVKVTSYRQSGAGMAPLMAVDVWRRAGVQPVTAQSSPLWLIHVWGIRCIKSQIVEICMCVLPF